MNPIIAGSRKSHAASVSRRFQAENRDFGFGNVVGTAAALIGTYSCRIQIAGAVCSIQISGNACYPRAYEAGATLSSLSGTSSSAIHVVRVGMPKVGERRLR
jgi:hypothetical protein